ncbi:ferritin-like domain-containing protein [Pantoea rodasii]|nr:ferritin-like domain-containing protein [Pantoea rodasii]
MSTTSALSHYHDWLRDAHAMEKQADLLSAPPASPT